jgi:hypothetical protein
MDDPYVAAGLLELPIEALLDHPQMDHVA